MSLTIQKVAEAAGPGSWIETATYWDCGCFVTSSKCLTTGVEDDLKVHTCSKHPICRVCRDEIAAGRTRCGIHVCENCMENHNPKECEACVEEAYHAHADYAYDRSRDQ